MIKSNLAPIPLKKVAMVTSKTAIFNFLFDSDFKLTFFYIISD